MKYASWIVIVCGLLLFTHALAGGDDFVEIRGATGGAAISFTNGSSEVKTKGDHEIVATLASNPTTGYRWQLMKPLAESTVKLISHVYNPPQTGLVGAGGQEIWIFRTVGGGETNIELGYLRPWEKGVAPVSIRTIRLKVFP